MLLFERNNDVHTRYFACSAYRERKQCPAYIPFFEWCNTKKKDTSMSKIKIGGKYLHERSQRMDVVRLTVLPTVANQSCEERHYCHTCEELILDKRLHHDHKITTTILDDALSSPLQVLK